MAAANKVGKTPGDENIPLSSNGNIHNKRPPKSVSRIPVSVTRKTRSHHNILQNAETKLENNGEIEEFIADPESLNDILAEKPITMTGNRSDSKLPFLDNTPACVRMSVYRNRDAIKHPSQMPSSVSKRRINELRERLVQSTARIHERRRETLTNLDDLSLNLNKEFNNTIPKSPSCPSFSNRAYITTVMQQSPSLPELRSTPAYYKEACITPLCTRSTTLLTPQYTAPTPISNKLQHAMMPFFDIEDELVSILRHGSQPSGLCRTYCTNPVAKQLCNDYDY